MAKPKEVYSADDVLALIDEFEEDEVDSICFPGSDEELDTESEEEDTEEPAVDAEKDVVEESAIESGSIGSR